MRDLAWIDDEEIYIYIKNLDKLKVKKLQLFKQIEKSLELYEEFWAQNREEKSVIFKKV